MMLGIIPARAGSKGIPNKNIYPLCGKPLIEYTIDAVRNSKANDYMISTDIMSMIDKYYNNIILRPQELALDHIKSIEVIKHVIKEYEFYHNTRVDDVILLQPTSPLRTTQDIDNAIQTYYKSGVKSLYSGYYMGLKHKSKTYDKHIDKPHFQRNGAIFITSRELINKGLIWDDDVIEYEMPHYRSIDIDTMEDMKEAEMLIKGGVLGEYSKSNHECNCGMFLHNKPTVTTWYNPDIENY